MRVGLVDEVLNGGDPGGSRWIQVWLCRRTISSGREGAPQADHRGDERELIVLAVAVRRHRVGPARPVRGDPDRSRATASWLHVLACAVPAEQRSDGWFLGNVNPALRQHRQGHPVHFGPLSETVHSVRIFVDGTHGVEVGIDCMSVT